MADSWIPLAAAGAAFVGGAAGSWLQVRYGAASWRRETRRDAYVKFLDAEHKFYNRFLDGLDTVAQLDPHSESYSERKANAYEKVPCLDYGPFASRWRQVLAAESLLGRALSSVNLAGPRSASEAAESVVNHTHAITADVERKLAVTYDVEDMAGLVNASRDEGTGEYEGLSEWADANGRLRREGTGGSRHQ
jgi:hypothetical protein